MAGWGKLVVMGALMAVGVMASPQPGDVYREVIWRGPFVNAGNWQRVTDPDAPHEGARAHLPNPVNQVTLESLEGVVVAEIALEQWGGHAGTSAKRIRINGHDWIDIPEPAEIPGTAGAGTNSNRNPECYQYLAHPTVRIPVHQLQEGANTFEFGAGRQICYDFGWGQWGVYGVIFRFYFDPDTTPHSTGRIVTPIAGDLFSDELHISFESDDDVIESDDEAIESVDFIGLYEDFDIKGDGSWRTWQFNYQDGNLRHHLGTVTESPWSVTWDSRWVPDQSEAVELMARVRRRDGLYHLTEPVKGLRLQREDRSVQLYKPYNVPSRWQARTGRTQSNNVYIPHDLQDVVAAQMILRSWSGGHAEAIGLNEVSIVPRVGRPHGRSYDILEVPADLLQSGKNTAYTFSDTEEHGIEVLWPGIALKVAYDRQQRPPALADEEILAEHLNPMWRLTTDEGSTVVAAADAGRPGGRVTQVQATGPSWDLELQRRLPLDVSHHRFLQFWFRADVIMAEPSTRMQIVINDRPPQRLASLLTKRIDLASEDWQMVQIHLDSLNLKPRYLQSITLSGQFSGRFLLDDLQVLRDPSTAIRDIDDQTTLPAAVKLSHAYPNPFNANTTLTVDVDRGAQVRLTIFDAVGRRVMELQNGPMSTGRHVVTWNGQDERGRRVGSGVYLARLTGAGTTQVQRLLLLK